MTMSMQATRQNAASTEFFNRISLDPTYTNLAWGPPESVRADLQFRRKQSLTTSLKKIGSNQPSGDAYFLGCAVPGQRNWLLDDACYGGAVHTRRTVAV